MNEEDTLIINEANVRMIVAGLDALNPDTEQEANLRLILRNTFSLIAEVYDELALTPLHTLAKEEEQP